MRITLALLLCSASLLGCRTPPDDGTVLGNDFAQSAPDQSTAPDMAHLFGGGAIGDPCTAGGDCMSGYCETRGFPGGYCTIVVAECPAPGGTQNVCPAGSACEMILVGEDLSADLCIKTCGTTGGTCRTGGGYSCCTLFQMSELCLPSNLCAR